MSREEFRFTCELPNGLHARPASYLVRNTQNYKANITLHNIRNRQEANGKSVLSLIAADVSFHDTCTIVIEGEDAGQALKQIRYFITHELPACDTPLDGKELSRRLPPSLAHLKLDACYGQATDDGWAIGAPVWLKEYRFSPREDHPVYSGVTGERLRLLGALKHVKQHLKSAIDNAELVAEREILNAHLALACDPDFQSRLLEHVDNGLSVAESIEATLEHFSRILESGENSYLRDRVIDIRDLCDQILRLSYGSGRLYSPDFLMQNSICLADNLTPSQFLALDKRFLKGLVLQTGGKASHTVLLARARGIPVIVGAKGARELMTQARQVILDAGLGLLISNPREQVLRYYQQEERKSQKQRDRYEPFVSAKAITRDGVAVEVAGNIVGIDDAELTFSSGAESIGLFRTEMLFMERSQAPCEDEQLAIYRSVVRLAKGRTVIIRTIDLGADKPVDYLNLADEQNPFLGYRAVRLYPQFLEYFKTQLRAILQAAALGPVKVMIPMITSVDEVIWVREVIDQVIEDLTLAGKQAGAIEFGIMVEVPSCVFIIDQLAQHVDFFSIGTNDLTQYFLAADRGNEKVGHLYNRLHPSFLRMLNKIAQDVKAHNKWLGVCGDMASDVRTLPLWVGLGVNELSLIAGHIPEIKEKLSHLDFPACRELLSKILSCESSESVEKLLRQCRVESGVHPALDKPIIAVGFDALSKEEVIKELVDLLDLDGRVTNPQSIEEAIWKREAVYSTGLGLGIAIPHCQSNDIYSDSIGIVRLKNPVDWQAMDNQPVDLVFLLAVRKSGTSEGHMKLFASLARKLVNDTFLAVLRRCETADEMLKVLKLELVELVEYTK